MAHLDHFEVLRGDGFVFGEYDYTVNFHPKGLRTELSFFLRRYPFFERYEWVHSFLGIEKHQGVLHHYGKDREAFGEKLKRMNQTALFQKKGLPLIDQLEKMRVFYAVMEKMKELFDSTLPDAKEGKDFKNFQDHYIKNFSPLIQKITLDDHKRGVSLMDSQASTASEHLEIFKSGKMVTAFLGNLIEKAMGVKEYTPEIREKMALEFTKDYEDTLVKLNTVLEKKKKQASEFLEESSPPPPEKSTPLGDG